MSKIRLEVVLNRHPRCIFVETTIDGEKLGLKNIGGDVESLLCQEWKKEKTKEGYLLSLEFEADVEKKKEKSKSGNDMVEHIYFTNIR